MRHPLNCLLCLASALIALPALALDTGNVVPVKPERPAIVPAAPDPAVLRQGGDTILDAVPITIGATFDGTTVGYTNDYDETCPYGGSTSPDVVYTFTPTVTLEITVDMYGSAYDTKIYIWDQDCVLVACNDDFYSDYTSRLEDVEVQAGVQYFLIIDGYGGTSGVYTALVEEYVPCVVSCPAGWSIHEDEPPLVDGYEDAYNGGCNSPQYNYPFQYLYGGVFCGRTGYYVNASGGASRDTDWFTVHVPTVGYLEITGDAEEACYMFELGPQDCGSVSVIQNMIIGPCIAASMTIVGSPGSVVWFWVGPQRFWEGETYEFDYVLINFDIIDAVENHSWTSVKQLFD